ncbi:MAG: NAD-dependent epimerase/dehydratase family protein [Proteobacteria bacterium]|nr:NAD-dependent epimerase/dehydratase family protein [Pseudomonadota bacterium]
MRILITGGAGCLGSSLVERYHSMGHEILVLDNFATSARGAMRATNNLVVVEGSVGNAALVDQCFSEFAPTHVIHSAAAYKEPDDWIEDIETNVQGAANIARASLKHRVKRVVNFQTALIYGTPEVVPIPVEHRVAPVSSYAISKAAGEVYLALIAHEIPYVSLRLANVCGPRLAIGPIPTFYQRIKAGKPCYCSDTVRDFLDMEDFHSLMDTVMEDQAPAGVFNVSTGEGRSIKQLFDVVAEYLGHIPEGPIRIVPPGSDDIKSVVLDPKHTETVLGWKAKIGFEETIKRALKWYDEHGVAEIFSHLIASTPTTSTMSEAK